MKIPTSAAKILTLLKEDPTQMYPAQYIIEKLAISPSSVYNAISHLHAFDMIEKHTEKGNNTIKYYSIKL